MSDEELIAITKSSHSMGEAARKSGIPQTTFKRRATKLGVYKPNVQSYRVPGFSIDRPSKPKPKCGRCSKVDLQPNNITGFCRQCYQELKNKERIEKWLKTGETGNKAGGMIRNCIRFYILDSQDYKCSICKIDDTWNGKPLNFVLDHINGDASNNFRDNLRLVCHNCDSQLPTYKSKNKNSVRKRWRVTQEA